MNSIRRKWDETKVDKMYKSSTARFDSVEALRYAAMEHPEPSKIVGVDDAKYIAMEKADPATAREWRELDRRRAARMSGKTALKDMDSDDSGPVDLSLSGVPQTKYDWSDD